MTPNYELNCLVKRLDCSVVVKVKVTGKVKNSSECSSQRYLLNRWTFCSQTWYGDAPSWTRVLCKKIDLLFQVLDHSEDWYDQIYDCFWYISIELPIFLHPNLVGWHVIISWRGVFCCCCCCCCVCVKIRLLFLRSRSPGRIKTLLDLYVFYIFCTTDLLATKLAVLIYYC